MSLPYDLVPQVGSQGRVGFILLSADETLEEEWRHLRPAGDIAHFTTRIESAAEVSTASLADMEQRLTRTAATLPAAVGFDVVGYACTSAASVIGSGDVARHIRQGVRTRHVTDPVEALIARCREQGLGRLGLISPYTESVNDSLRAALADAGIETPVFASFDEAVETRVARIDPKATQAAALRLGAEPGLDGVFLSCTNLRTAGVLKDLGDALGKPVLSSNSVLFARMLSLISI